MPPELDAQIGAEAERDGLTYSAWLTAAARKELAIRTGLDAVAEVEAEIGAFTSEELAEANEWTDRVAGRTQRSGTPEQQAA